MVTASSQKQGPRQEANVSMDAQRAVGLVRQVVPVAG